MFAFPVEDLVYIHDLIIERSGGAPGILNRGHLEAALARPYQSAHGEEVHGELFEKAAALLDSVANNHGFVDGNKRTAMAAAGFFLFLHNIDLRITNKDYEVFMLHVVQNRPPIKEIRLWLQSRSEIIIG